MIMSQYSNVEFHIDRGILLYHLRDKRLKIKMNVTYFCSDPLKYVFIPIHTFTFVKYNRFHFVHTYFRSISFKYRITAGFPFDTDRRVVRFPMRFESCTYCV